MGENTAGISVKVCYIHFLEVFSRDYLSGAVSFIRLFDIRNRCFCNGITFRNWLRFWIWMYSVFYRTIHRDQGSTEITTKKIDYTRNQRRFSENSQMKILLTYENNDELIQMLKNYVKRR